MFVLIIGGGRIGAGLAAALVELGVEVGIVEKNEARADEIRDSLGTVEVTHGDGDEPVVLESAHVSRAQIVAAMTDDDEDNLVACLLARREYAIPWTVGRVNNPKNAWLFGQRFEVDEAAPADSLDVVGLAEHLAARR